MTERRRPGRPPGRQMGKALHVKLPEDLEDRVCAVALRQEKSVSEVIRAALRRMLRDEQGASVNV